MDSVGDSTEVREDFKFCRCPRSTQCSSRSVHLYIAYTYHNWTANVHEETSRCLGRLFHGSPVRNSLSNLQSMLKLTSKSAIAASVVGLVFRVKAFLVQDEWSSAILYVCV